jgi:hypothetical protein
MIPFLAIVQNGERQGHKYFITVLVGCEEYSGTFDMPNSVGTLQLSASKMMSTSRVNRPRQRFFWSAIQPYRSTPLGRQLAL